MTTPHLVDAENNTSILVVANVGGDVREQERARAVDAAGAGTQRVFKEGVETFVGGGLVGLGRR